MNLKEEKTRETEGGHSLARSRPPIGDSPDSRFSFMFVYQNREECK